MVLGRKKRRGGRGGGANNFYEYWSLFPQHWAGFVIFTTVDPTITERATITRQDWGGLLHLHHLSGKKASAISSNLQLHLASRLMLGSKCIYGQGTYEEPDLKFHGSFQQ